MKIFYKLKLIIIITIINLSYTGFAANMKDAPYHHLPDGTFRNPEGSPERDPNIKWSMSKWNKEKKKIKINIPSDHVVDKKEVLKNLEKYKNGDYVAWIGHATFLIKLGNTTIITDPLFSKTSFLFITWSGGILILIFFFSLFHFDIDHLILGSLFGLPSGFLKVPSAR